MKGCGDTEGFRVRMVPTAHTHRLGSAGPWFLTGIDTDRQFPLVEAGTRVDKGTNSDLREL